MNKPTFGTYRGWSDKWVYGGVLHGCGKAFIIEYHDDVVDDPFLHPKYDESLLDNIIEVDLKSLAMFTGLYDSEDTPIYGSIPLSDGTMSRGGDFVGGSLVRYSLEYGRFVGQCDNPFLDRLNDLLSMFRDLDITISDNLEGYEYPVKGNAYENPELLEVNK